MSDCVEWSGHRDRDGYGKSNGKRAHRVAYEREVGPIPDGLQLDHLCRNRACVNVAHLEPVAPRENTLRSPIAPAAMNARKTHCLRGHEFTPENTYPQPGGRMCRECHRQAVARYRAKRKKESA